MASLSFYGATGTVTGSRFLLDTGSNRILVDCGMFQGLKDLRQRNREPFQEDPSSVDRVILTHAHIDHTGYLPRFCADGFTGPVHSTHATRDLCEIMLRDSAHIQEEDAKWANIKGFSQHEPALPLYTMQDAEQALGQFSALHYGEDYGIGDSLRVKLKDSGHILGSAFVDIKSGTGDATRKILFSGDIGRPDKPILRDPVQVYDVDYLVLESTYGDRLHNHGAPDAELARIINESVERGGVLLIPSFAVGRTQTLLYVLRELEERREIPPLPIYVDSPMSIRATEVFEKRLVDLDLTARMLTFDGKKIFRPGRLETCRTRDQSKALNELSGPAIIISSSGMVTGGRILHHMMKRLRNPATTVLFIGYQAEGTRGRSILNGEPVVKIHGHDIPVAAQIESISGFSGHADYNEMLAWLMGFNRPPEKTFIVHGEPEVSGVFADKIREAFGWNVVVPAFGETVELEL